MDSKAGAILVVMLAFFVGWTLYEAYDAWATKRYNDESKKALQQLVLGQDYKGSHWVKPITFSELVTFSKENYETSPFWYDVYKSLQ